MGAEGVAHSAETAAKDAAVEVVDVVVEYVLPIVLFFFGFILAVMLGLSGFFDVFVSQSPLGASLQALVSEGAAILVYLILGAGLIAVGHHHDNWVGDIVGAFGWMFVGAGLGEGANALLGNAPIAGAMDGNALPSSLESTASGK